MNSATFADALVALGARYRIEEIGKLAVLVPDGAAALDPRTRRAIVTAGRAHGFTNVCIEIDAVDAALPGD